MRSNIRQVCSNKNTKPVVNICSLIFFNSPIEIAQEFQNDDDYTSLVTC